MNSLFILSLIEGLNFSNFTGNVFVYAFDPYLSLLGNFTWGIIFGFIGAGVYVASERQLLTTTGYLILMGVIFAVIMSTSLVTILGLILAFIISSMMYHAFVEKR